MQRLAGNRPASQFHPAAPTMAFPMMPMPRKPILVAPGAAVGTAAAEAAHTWVARRRRRGPWAALCGRCTASGQQVRLWHGLRGAAAAANARGPHCQGRAPCETGEATSAACILVVGDPQVSTITPMDNSAFGLGCKCPTHSTPSRASVEQIEAHLTPPSSRIAVGH